MKKDVSLCIHLNLSKLFFFFNSFHCISYNKDNQLIIYSIEFVKAFFLFIVSPTIRIIN